MRPEGGDLAYIWDMRRFALEVQESVRGVTYDRFTNEWQLRRAIERSIEIIGEAASRVSKEYRFLHPEIPWNAIVAQRNMLAHGYGDIRDDAIWRVATIRIPELLALLLPLLDGGDV